MGVPGRLLAAIWPMLVGGARSVLCLVKRYADPLAQKKEQWVGGMLQSRL